MHEWIALIIFSVSMLITPGPNNLLLMNSGVHFGIRQSMPHYLGICLGFPLMVCLVSLGLGSFIHEYPLFRVTLKYGGAAYMLYLAWHIYRAHEPGRAKSQKKPFTFMHAVLFQWINIKAWMMAVGVASLFSLSTSVIFNALIIGLIMLIIGIPSTAIWLWGGAFLKKFLKEDSHFHRFNTIMAIALVISIAMIFIE